MAKCCNCGKSFDYEKYYGICPKCSAYNREEMPEEAYEKIYKEDDIQNPHIREKGSGQQIIRKTSGVSIAVFICLIIGITAGGLIAFAGTGILIYGNAIQEGRIGSVPDKGDGVEGTFDYEAEEPVKQNKKKQSAKTIEKHAGEAFVLGDMTQCSITVKQAYIFKNAGIEERVPKGQNLVAVQVDYQCPKWEDYQYHEYMFSGTPYIGYQGVFKECINKFSIIGYIDESVSEELLDFWNMIQSANGTGIFLVLVPEGITEIQFYMDSRMEDTNDISVIYSVPLEIKAEEVV